MTTHALLPPSPLRYVSSFLSSEDFSPSSLVDSHRIALQCEYTRAPSDKTSVLLLWLIRIELHYSTSIHGPQARRLQPFFLGRFASNCTAVRAYTGPKPEDNQPFFLGRFESNCTTVQEYTGPKPEDNQPFFLGRFASNCTTVRVYTGPNRDTMFT